jgi:hypothetical protein
MSDKLQLMAEQLMRLAEEFTEELERQEKSAGSVPYTVLVSLMSHEAESVVQIAAGDSEHLEQMCVVGIMHARGEAELEKETLQ